MSEIKNKLAYFPKGIDRQTLIRINQDVSESENFFEMLLDMVTSEGLLDIYQAEKVELFRRYRSEDKIVILVTPNQTDLISLNSKIFKDIFRRKNSLIAVVMNSEFNKRFHNQRAEKSLELLGDVLDVIDEAVIEVENAQKDGNKILGSKDVAKMRGIKKI